MRRGLLAVPLLFAALLTVSTPASASVRRADAPTATLHASAERIGWTGGSLSLTAVVRNGKSCQFFSVPAVSGIDGTVACGHGKVTRKGKVPPYVQRASRPIRARRLGSERDVGDRAHRPPDRQASSVREEPCRLPAVRMRSGDDVRVRNPGQCGLDASSGHTATALSAADSTSTSTAGTWSIFNDAGPLDLNGSGVGRRRLLRQRGLLLPSRHVVLVVVRSDRSRHSRDSAARPRTSAELCRLRSRESTRTAARSP